MKYTILIILSCVLTVNAAQLISGRIPIPTITFSNRTATITITNKLIQVSTPTIISGALVSAGASGGGMVSGNAGVSGGEKIK